MGGQDRKAGVAQGLLLLVASALPVMGVVLLSPIAQRLPEAIGGGAEGARLAPLILTAPALAIALFSAIAGFLLDRFGRRVCFLTALFLYAFVGTAPMWIANPYVIVAARFCLGMTEAVILASTMALVGDYYSGAERDRWIAYMMAVAAFAATIFYITGGALAAISWKAPFIAYGAGAFIFLAALPIIFEPKRQSREPAMQAVAAEVPKGQTWKIGVVLAATFVGSILFYVVPLQLGRFLEARGVASYATIGLLIAVAGLGNPIGSFCFRYLRSIPFWMLLGGSTAVAGAGFALAAAWQGVTGLVVGAFINQLGCGILCPLTMAAVLRLAPAQGRGKSSGGWSTAFFVGQFFSPLAVLPLIALAGSGDGLPALAIANFAFAIAGAVVFSAPAFRAANADGEAAEAHDEAEVASMPVAEARA